MFDAALRYLLFPAGTIALASLLYILLINLIKPKTKTHKLPSMIFLLNKQSKRKRYRWLRYLPSNWLMYLHLLIALTLSLAIMNPFIMQPESHTKDQAIHVIDVSASMSAAGRFARAIDLAKENLAERNTVVVVSSVPYIALENAPTGKTRQFLGSLSVQHTTTPLVNALLLAQSAAATDTAIHIYSDMKDTTSMSPELTSIIARMEGNKNIVILHPLVEGENNIGIIGAELSDENITLQIKNYNDFPIDTRLITGNEEYPLSIQPYDIILQTVPTPAEPTRFRVDHTDDLATDNTFYFASLPKGTFPTLYITNKENPFMSTALSLFPFIETTTYNPPGISDAEDYKVFIFENANASKMLPGTIQKALTQAENGGVIVFKMTESLRSSPMTEHLPVSHIGTKKLAPVRMMDHELTESLTAASEEMIYPAQVREGASVLMESTTGEPIVVMAEHGDGKIIYYGIDDSYHKAQFKLSYAYPILFQRILQDALHYPVLDELNKKSDAVQAGSGTIRLPDRRTVRLPVILARTGFYESGNLVLSSNLLNIEESDISAESDISKTSIETVLAEEDVKVGQRNILIVLAIALLLFELAVLKWRGEL